MPDNLAQSAAYCCTEVLVKRRFEITCTLLSYSVGYNLQRIRESRVRRREVPAPLAG
jgi:hypothetical protein